VAAADDTDGEKEDGHGHGEGGVVVLQCAATVGAVQPAGTI